MSGISALLRLSRELASLSAIYHVKTQGELAACNPEEGLHTWPCGTLILDFQPPEL